MDLYILNNPDVAERTSEATRRALEDRAAPAVQRERFLAPPHYALLQQLAAAILPQDVIGTSVDIAEVIDRRLGEGKSGGWRFADLPGDGEAYRRGLQVFSDMLQQTPFNTFERMPVPGREGYLRCVANGDVDGPAQFPLSKWLQMLRTDAVKIWLAHPETMHQIGYYGFADGATGETNGPTESEGWIAITPDRALPFELGAAMPRAARGEA